MAPPIRISHPLRLVTQRLETTPVDQLPYIANQLADNLSDCKALLRTPSEQIKKGSEDGTALHKYKTQISTLLQTKSVPGRWAAVFLVKSTIEAGGIEVIQGVAQWVRSLLGYLGRPDPASTKKIVIITLTRIFDITHGNPSVIREITTPTLPAFLTNCLNCISTGSQTNRIAKLGSPLLKVVLQAFIKLLPHHPSTFRPFVNQVKPVLSALIAPTPSSLSSEVTSAKLRTHIAMTVTGLAQRLHALLSYSAPKNASSEQWLRSVNAICEHTNQTATQVFRALVEENLGSRSSRSHVVRNFDEEPADSIEDELTLPPWEGIFAGSERIIGLLELLQAYLATTSPLALSIPLSSIWSLIERMLSVFGPGDNSGEKENYTRVKPEAGREEREALWQALPKIHKSAIDLAEVLFTRVGVSSMSFAHIVLDRLVWTFTRDSKHDKVRLSSYRLAVHVLELVGPSLAKVNVSSIELLISRACQDISAIHVNPLDSSYNIGGNTNRPSKHRDRECLSKVSETAEVFLVTCLTRIRPETWSSSVRALVDRTAILLQAREPLIASVLHPPQSGGRTVASILPFLARAHPQAPAVEALVRPRLPVIRTGQRRHNNIYERVQEDADDTEDEDMTMNSTINAHDLRPASEAAGKMPALDVSTRTSTMAAPIEAPLPSPFASVQSPKRFREDDKDNQTFRPMTLGTEPEQKRPRVEENSVEAAQSEDPPTSIQDKGEGMEIYTAPPPMEDKVIAIPKAAGPEASNTATESKAGEDSDESGSEIPSIHMDSDLEDEVEDDEEDDGT